MLLTLSSEENSQRFWEINTKSFQFLIKPRKKGSIKYALVVVESKADLATVTGLVHKKSVNGKELDVSAAKAPHERGTYLNRVAGLKRLEKFRSVWPAPTYKKLASSDPLKNLAFPPSYIHGEKLSVKPSKTIKKRVAAPSNALLLSKIPAGVTKKQILEAFKGAKVRRTQLHKNYGFLIFKDAEARKKAQEAAKDNKINIGDKTVSVTESKKYARKTVEVPREVKAAKPAEKKELTANAIAKKRFAAYRRDLQSHQRRIVRLAAIKKLNEHKLAVSQGKAQPRVVRKLQPKKVIAKSNPAVEKREKKRAQRKATRAAKKNKKVVRKSAKLIPAKKAAAEVATA